MVTIGTGGGDGGGGVSDTGTGGGDDTTAGPSISFRIGGTTMTIQLGLAGLFNVSPGTTSTNVADLVPFSDPPDSQFTVKNSDATPFFLLINTTIRMPLVRAGADATVANVLGILKSPYLTGGLRNSDASSGSSGSG